MHTVGYYYYYYYYYYAYITSYSFARYGVYRVRVSCRRTLFDDR